jgi:hypothetical protein
VYPRTILDAVAKRKIPSPHQESNPRTPIVQPVAQHYTDWAITLACKILYGDIINKPANSVLNILG